MAIVGFTGLWVVNKQRLDPFGSALDPFGSAPDVPARVLQERRFARGLSALAAPGGAGLLRTERKRRRKQGS